MNYLNLLFLPILIYNLEIYKRYFEFFIIYNQQRILIFEIFVKNFQYYYNCHYISIFIIHAQETIFLVFV